MSTNVWPGGLRVGSGSGTSWVSSTSAPGSLSSNPPAASSWLRYMSTRHCAICPWHCPSSCPGRHKSLESTVTLNCPLSPRVHCNPELPSLPLSVLRHLRLLEACRIGLAHPDAECWSFCLESFVIRPMNNSFSNFLRCFKMSLQ